MRRRRFVVIAAGVAAVAVLGLVGYRATYHNWPWEGHPARLHACGRDYDRARRTVTQAQIGDELHPAFRVPPVMGSQVMTRLPHDEFQALARSGEACGIDFFMKVGHDRYLPYALEGGP